MSNYSIQQIVKEPDEDSLNTMHEINLKYMIPITDGEAKQRQTLQDIGTMNAEEAKSYQDECVKISNRKLEKGVNYYFHGKIKRMSSVQSFDVKLVNYENITSNVVQWVKKIVVQSGDENDIVDIEFIFTPAADFDTILFEMVRTSADTPNQRQATIIYEELSIINNILPEKRKVLHIGVQSQPSILLCVNGQEMRVGRSGMYELNHPSLYITKFSVVHPLTFLQVSWNEITSSICLFRNAAASNRTIPAFTLDYQYEL